MRFPVTALLVLLAASTAADAHSELPSEQWCADGVAVEVASFRLEAAALERYAEDTCSTQDGAKTCGQFDDDYGNGLRGAQMHCAHFAQHDDALMEKGDVGTTSPLVSGPGEFLHRDHHRLFVLRMGVEGVCLRCEAAPRPVEPVRLKR